MTRLTLTATLILLGFLAACDTTHYPISDQTCGPHDPVLDMDTPSCQIPTP